jgi:hypothetical protein
MGTMPVEFERACERRWIAKSGRPAAATPLYEVDQNSAGEPGSSSADPAPDEKCCESGMSASRSPRLRYVSALADARRAILVSIDHLKRHALPVALDHDSRPDGPFQTERSTR